MQQENIRLIVFDMAGTTVNEDNVVYKTLRRAINGLGHNFTLETVLRDGGGKEKFQAIRDILSTVSQDEAKLEKDSRSAYGNFRQMLKEAYQNLEVSPCEGTEMLFEYLKKLGVKIVLNTGYDRKTAKSLIEKLNWQEGREFDLLVTADDVANSRPAPDMILLAMDQLGIADARQVAKVGDSVIDIEEGKAAGCRLTFAITTGAQTAKQLQTASPDFIIDSLLEIKDKIQFQNTIFQKT